MKYIEDDSAFDAWLKRYSAKQKAGNSKASRGKQVSKDEFFARTKGQLPQPKNTDG